MARATSTYRSSRVKGEFFGAHPASYFEGLKKVEQHNEELKQKQALATSF